MHALPILTAALETSATRYGGTEGPDFAQYGLMLVVLLATIGGLAWVFKRLVGGALVRRATERSLQVRDVLPLGAKQRLCVVRCYDRSFFLGVSDKRIDLIAELDAAAIGEAERPVPLAERQRAAFLQALERVQRGRAAETVVPAAPAPKPVAAAKPSPERRVRRRVAAAPEPQRAASNRVVNQPARKAARKPAAAAKPRSLAGGRGMLA